MSTATTASRGRWRGDVLCGVVVALAGAVLLVLARGIEAPPSGTGIGAATLPTAVSALLLLAGVALAVSGLRRGPAAPEPRDPTDPAAAIAGGDADDERVPPGRLAVMAGLFVAYALLFIPLGYLLSTALYLGAVLTVVDRERWRRNVVFAVVFAVVVYLGFTRFLDVLLPPGLLG